MCVSNVFKRKHNALNAFLNIIFTLVVANASGLMIIIIYILAARQLAICVLKRASYSGEGMKEPD
jgi:hypothetical protein